MATDDFSRRHLLAAIGAGAIVTRRAFAQPSARTISARLTQALQDGRVTGLHALLVSQAGKPVFEYYGRGTDEAWGWPLGTVTFAPDVLHDLRSVSKSVVGLVYGLALPAGKVPSPEASFTTSSPSRPTSKNGRAAIG